MSLLTWSRHETLTGSIVAKGQSTEYRVHKARTYTGPKYTLYYRAFNGPRAEKVGPFNFKALVFAEAEKIEEALRARR